jgi:hypothetical protein
MARPI